MRETVLLQSLNDFVEWRGAARRLLLAGTRPEAIEWREPAADAELFDDAGDDGRAVAGRDRPAGRVPPRFVRMAQAAICHRDPGRFALLYQLLWRLQKDRRILAIIDDPDVARVTRRVEAVVAAYSRMKAELRFRRSVAADGHKGLSAWYEPEHYVLERAAPHFTRQVAHEDWIIGTPYRSAYWDGKVLRFGPGGRRQAGR